MKKLVFVFSAIALIGASSCNKAYTCTCTTTSSANYAPQNYSIPSTTKSNATSTCSSWQTSQQTLSTAAGGGTVTCSI